MASAIDPTKPADGAPAVKQDLRGNLQAAKSEIEALQAGKTDFGHQHLLVDIADVGLLAGKDVVEAGDLATAAVDGTALADGAVGGTKLGDAAVASAKLADGAVTESKIAAGAVTLAKLGAGTAHRLLGYDDQGDPAELAQGAGGGLDADTLDGQQASTFAAALHGHSLADISDAGALASKDTVGANELAANSVTVTKIASNAVTSAKIAGAAVTGAKLAEGAITADKIEAGAIASDALAGAAVTTAKIADGHVTTAKLADGAVTQDKIASNAVGPAQLQDGIPIDMQGAVLSGAELRDYAETSPAATISGGGATLDLAAGSVFEIVLTGNLTSLMLTNPPAAGLAGAATLILRQDSIGGRTLAWPGSVRWAGGIPPSATGAPNAIDIYTLVTRDGGANWFGFLGGQDFS
jgi:hypothetical protein